MFSLAWNQEKDTLNVHAIPAMPEDSRLQPRICSHSAGQTARSSRGRSVEGRQYRNSKLEVGARK